MDAMNFFSSDGGGEYFQWKAQAKQFEVDGEAAEVSEIAIDPASLKTGVGKLARGQSPDWIWASSPGGRVDSPSEDYKPAFLINVYIDKTGWREWKTSAFGARQGLSRIWAEIQASQAMNAGKVCRLAYEKAEDMQVGPGHTAVPIFRIIGWDDMPDGENKPADFF